MNSQIELNAGSGFDGYLWSEGSDSQTITISEGGSYWVNVFDGQCYNADTIHIEPINCDLFVPIVFTPNGDIYNENFFAEASKDILDFHLTVFSRWGGVLWETTNKDDKWDGNYKGRKADEGTYFWLVQYKCMGSDQQFEKKGSVTLLR
ncbi:MAG: gliding motility-associated C-terminal domain-containing protein [Bacteroidales bacterium]